MHYSFFQINNYSGLWPELLANLLNTGHAGVKQILMIPVSLPESRTADSAGYLPLWVKGLAITCKNDAASVVSFGEGLPLGSP